MSIRLGVKTDKPPDSSNACVVHRACSVGDRVHSLSLPHGTGTRSLAVSSWRGPNARGCMGHRCSKGPGPQLHGFCNGVNGQSDDRLKVQKKQRLVTQTPEKETQVSDTPGGAGKHINSRDGGSGGR